MSDKKFRTPTHEEAQKIEDNFFAARRMRLADEEEKRRKCLQVRTVGTCFPSVCGGNIILTPREESVGEWRSGPMQKKIKYTCACSKCGCAYNAEHFLNREKEAVAAIAGASSPNEKQS